LGFAKPREKKKKKKEEEEKSLGVPPILASTWNQCVGDN
jgi:hypothetical protein